MTPEGERLDRHLRSTIAELSERQASKDDNMRGIERLANASGNLMQKADAIADAAAAKLEKAYARHVEIAARYEAFADQVAQKADEAADRLNQISNLPMPEASVDSEKPQE